METPEQRLQYQAHGQSYAFNTIALTKVIRVAKLLEPIKALSLKIRLFRKPLVFEEFKIANNF